MSLFCKFWITAVFLMAFLVITRVVTWIATFFVNIDRIADALEKIATTQ